jgi:hypothetical protein
LAGRPVSTGHRNARLTQRHNCLINDSLQALTCLVVIELKHQRDVHQRLKKLIGTRPSPVSQALRTALQQFAAITLTMNQTPDQIMNRDMHILCTVWVQKHALGTLQNNGNTLRSSTH